MDGPPPLSGDETAPVQTLRVLVPDPLLYSLGPHQNSETYDQWLNNSRCRSPRDNWGTTATRPPRLHVRPGVGCAEATNALPRPRVAPVTGQDVGDGTLPIALVEGGTYYPEGSLFTDCEVDGLH